MPMSGAGPKSGHERTDHLGENAIPRNGWCPHSNRPTTNGGRYWSAWLLQLQPYRTHSSNFMHIRSLRLPML